MLEVVLIADRSIPRPGHLLHFGWCPRPCNGQGLFKLESSPLHFVVSLRLSVSGYPLFLAERAVSKPYTTHIKFEARVN